MHIWKSIRIKAILCFIIIILISDSNNSQPVFSSQTTIRKYDSIIIRPQNIIDLNLGIQDAEENYKLIYYINFANGNKNLLKMYYRHLEVIGSESGNYYINRESFIIVYDLYNYKIIEINNINQDELYSLLIGSNGWDNSITLEDSRNTIGDIYKKIDYSSIYLLKSPDNTKVGGSIYYHVEKYDGRFVHDGMFTLPRIWNALDGNILYNAEYKEDFSKACVIKTKFSSNSRFFYVKYALTPVIDLIDTTTFETLPAQGDIAYTSDMHFMVTGRNNLPTLVDLTTLVEIQRYDIQGYMTACAFSPDDQELYIVDSYRRLYIFDAQLPTRINDWELYD